MVFERVNRRPCKIGGGPLETNINWPVARICWPLAALAAALVWSPAHAGRASSEFGVDAPELAHKGDYAVGVKTLRLIEPGQIDVLSFDAAAGTASRRDRELTVDLWYPARRQPGAARVVYSARLPSEPPAAPAAFTVPGIAVRAAPAAGTGFPLVIVSHGYSNDPAAMAWITENLASKGYVVAAIHHDDPPITDRSKIAQPYLRRPLDIAFVARTLQRTLANQLVDPRRLALIGYSMGGYGALTAAGAAWDPRSLTQVIPESVLQPYLQGGTLQGDLNVAGLKAVVAISPAGGGQRAAWGASGIEGITAPLMLISGDDDRTVDYATGARAFFDAAVRAHRFLLTFKGAGHSIGLGPAPRAMRSRLWDLDWFEDPVWRKERLNAIEAHFITAFLGRYVKGEESYAAYLDVPVSESSAGVWPASAGPGDYDAYSTGTGAITVWRGFQRRHAQGLELLQAGPLDPSARRGIAPHECEREQRRGDHQEQADRIQHRACAFAHAAVHHHGQGRIRTDQHQRGIEIRERHQKGNCRRAQQGGTQIGQQDHAEHGGSGGAEIQRRLLQRAIEAPQPGARR